VTSGASSVVVVPSGSAVADSSGNTGELATGSVVPVPSSGMAVEIGDIVSFAMAMASGVGDSSVIAIWFASDVSVALDVDTVVSDSAIVDSADPDPLATVTVMGAESLLLPT
jgi:hypothetical protein